MTRQLPSTLCRLFDSLHVFLKVRLHAASIYAANGARVVAEIELKEALRLAPAAFETREDVRDVRAAIAKLGANREVTKVASPAAFRGSHFREGDRHDCLTCRSPII
jgi:hypothetical protein